MNWQVRGVVCARCSVFHVTTAVHSKPFMLRSFESAVSYDSQIATSTIANRAELVRRGSGKDICSSHLLIDDSHLQLSLDEHNYHTGSRTLLARRTWKSAT
jgi:hypothetical protein